jgi:hypothetical protein
MGRKSESKTKIKFFIGKSDRWGIGIAFCKYDNSITINLLDRYFGFEVWRDVK